MLRLILLLLLSPASLAADLPWYKVEILVFAQLGEAGMTEEFWAEDPGMADLGNAYDLRKLMRAGNRIPAITQGGGAFRQLPPEQLELADIWLNLRRSAGYRPLLHSGWIQPGFSHEQAQLLRITTGPTAAGAFTSSPAVIDGSLSVYLERYLHVDADLNYYRAPTTALNTPPGSDELLESLPPSLFRLRQSRRMRLEELHYLDHPLFGLLIRIARFEPRAADAAEDSTAESMPAGANPQTGQASKSLP